MGKIEMNLPLQFNGQVVCALMPFPITTVIKKRYKPLNPGAVGPRDEMHLKPFSKAGELIEASLNCLAITFPLAGDDPKVMVRRECFYPSPSEARF
jgi:hypothetical protein